jgi:hypothetical protein
MSDIRKKPEQIEIPTDPISGPAFLPPRRKPRADSEPPLGRTTDKPHESEG